MSSNGRLVHIEPFHGEATIAQSPVDEVLDCLLGAANGRKSDELSGELDLPIESLGDRILNRVR